MLPETDVMFTDLETKGFVVLRNFLPADMLEASCNDYTQQPVGGNRNYGISNASPTANELLRPLVNDVLERVRRETSLHVDRPSGAVYFATGRGINFSWHQDHESFFTIQNHYDYLNFYIPIIKPVRNKTNLSIIPFDVLERKSPRMFRRVVRGGAARFVPLGRRALVFLDDIGSLHLMRENLEEMAHTPLLDPGDLLLMRGDMIHRTQDTQTRRVAMSFRASNSLATVTRARLADGGWFKAAMMAKNAATYRKMFMAFDATHASEMSAADLMKAMDGIQEVTGTGRRFPFLLLREKLQAGVLGRFVPRAINGWVAEKCVQQYVNRAALAQMRKAQQAQAQQSGVNG